MPSLGADMETGTLVAYRCEPGARVERGGILAEIETDKGVIEVESHVSGVLERWLVPLGSRVPVGAVLATLQDDGEAPELGRTVQAPKTGASRAVASVEERALAPSPPSTTIPPDTRATPSARKRARELGVDLHELKTDAVLTPRDVERAATTLAARVEPAAGAGDGPGRRRISPAALRLAQELRVDVRALDPRLEPIHIADVERHVRLHSQAVDRDLVEGPRRAIAAAMARAKREIPHYYLSTTVNLAAASRWLEEHNGAHSVRDRLLLGVLYLRAVALATARMPDFNVRWTELGPRRQPEVHLGVAISLRGGGLISPAIAAAASRSLPELMNAFQDLVARARSGRLRSSELSTGTITVTSLGERGVDAVFPIIHPPQSAIVGFGRSAARPWVENGELCVRPLVQLTLAADHRITDGHAGARYLALIEQLLQEPERL